MKAFKIFFFSWLFLIQQVYATQSLFLENRGAAVSHYTYYRDHIHALSMTLRNNQSRLAGNPNRNEARQIVDQIFNEKNGLSHWRRPQASDFERINRIRQHVSRLREIAPDFLEGALANPVNDRGIRSFTLESFMAESGGGREQRPAYCENYPNLDRETLRSFYGDVEEGEGFVCYPLNGNGVGLDLSTMGEALVSLERDAFREQKNELQNGLVVEAVTGILDESATYAGIYPGTDNNLRGLRRCAQSHPNIDGLSDAVNNHHRTLDSRISELNAPFGPEENARRNALMAMQVRQALIIGNLYNITSRAQTRRDGQQVAILGPNGRQNFSNEVIVRCQREMETAHGFSFTFSGLGRLNGIEQCQRLVREGRFEDRWECHEALVAFNENPSNLTAQRNCYFRESGMGDQVLREVSADQLIPLMSASVDSHPLLFNREDNRSLIPFVSSESNYVPSDFARAVQAMPGADVISRAVEDVLAGNPDNPQLAIEERLSQPEMLTAMAGLIDQAQASEELNNSLKNEITQYQNELGESAAGVCESEGEHLHQFPSLVQSVISKELEEVSDPVERQHLLARRQAAECWLLQEDPPEYEGGLPTGFIALGVGALALGLVPGVGWAASAALIAAGTAVTGADSYLRFDHSRDRLAAATAAYQGGWSDAQYVLERAAIATDSQTALWVEGLSVGILDVASPAARALYRTVRSNEEIAARINRFAGRGDRESVDAVVSEIDRDLASSVPYQFVTRTDDGELNLMYSVDSRLHVREGHVFDFSAMRMTERIEEISTNANGQISNRMVKRFRSQAQRENVINEVAGLIANADNSPFRSGVPRVTYFPENVRPSHVIAEVRHDNVTVIGVDPERGTRELRYRDSEGRVYAMFSCATDDCYVPGVNGGASRHGDVGEITSVFPLCGPGVRRVGRAHEVAESLLQARVAGNVSNMDYSSFIERNVTCPDNVMTTTVRDLDY